MLAGLAMKWRWRQRREAAGEDTTRPNMVLGSNVQVVWEKFCRYWDVEPRYVPVTKGRYTVTPEDAVARVDENTIVLSSAINVGLSAVDVNTGTVRSLTEVDTDVGELPFIIVADGKASAMLEQEAPGEPGILAIAHELRWRMNAQRASPGGVGAPGNR